VFFVSIRLRLSWFGTPSKRGEKSIVLTDDTIEVVVNFNIIVNNALLLLIDIYFRNQHCCFYGVAFHLDVLSSQLDIQNKQKMA
jgi:hypothetical protein